MVGQWSETYPSYDPDADITRDGVVDVDDLNVHLGAPTGSVPPDTVGHGNGNIVGYAGYIFEEEIGLYLVRNRWYDPGNGRWLGRDPAGYVNGTSLYEYCAGNPLMYTDPFGLCVSPSYDSGGGGGGEGVAPSDGGGGGGLGVAPSDEGEGGGGGGGNGLYDPFKELGVDGDFNEPGSAIAVGRVIQAEELREDLEEIGEATTYLPGVGAVAEAGYTIHAASVGDGDRFALGLLTTVGAFFGLKYFAVIGENSARMIARSRVRNVHGGTATVETALDNAQKWLGTGYKEISPGVYRSADGARQFRMTDSDLLDNQPHVHFEAVGPDGRFIEENSHVYLKDR